jgi:putative DNA primase/helicase
VNVSDLLPRLEGVRPHAGYFIARCPAHSDRNASFSVREGAHGIALVKCFAGCSYESIVAALGGRPWRTPSGISVTSPRRATDDAKRTDGALRIWCEAREAVRTPVERYLLSRSITIPTPTSLRFHACLKHPRGGYLPAMVAAVETLEGNFVAIHRTYLRQDGADKADVEPVKMMLGPCAGGAVWFAKPSSTIAIAEGIETALSIAQACPDLAVSAALSTSGMRTLRLPAVVRQVIICADNDQNGAGEWAAEAAAGRFMREGRKVRIAKPARVNDFNDVLRS